MIWSIITAAASGGSRTNYDDSRDHGEEDEKEEPLTLQAEHEYSNPTKIGKNRYSVLDGTLEVEV